MNNKILNSISFLLCLIISSCGHNGSDAIYSTLPEITTIPTTENLEKQEEVKLPATEEQNIVLENTLPSSEPTIQTTTLTNNTSSDNLSYIPNSPTTNIASISSFKTFSPKSYTSPMLNAYFASVGNDGNKSIFQKSIGIKETKNGYEINIKPSDLFTQMYEEAKSLPEAKEDEDDTEEILAVADFDVKYNFHFVNKKELLDYLEKYKENILDKYRIESEEETSDELIYKYKSEETPYIMYSKTNQNVGKAYSSFEELQSNTPELKELSCIRNCKQEEIESNASPVFTYKGKDYSLEELQKLNDLEFRNLKFDGSSFSYNTEQEIVRYKDKDLLDGLTVGTSTSSNVEKDEIKEEEVKEKYLTLNFLGKGADLSYSDFGYWKEKEVYDGYERIGVIQPFIGGMEDKKIEEKEISKGTVFNGIVIGHVKELNKNSESIKGSIEYRLNDKKEFNIKFKDWYDIEISGEDWSLKEKE
ncbi:MAG: hypothetical protein IJ638_01410 [Alphaproteobacteria bacterium]|nr:hypothetical protein [Alphaproteobacteria bacterium]